MPSGWDDQGAFRFKIRGIFMILQPIIDVSVWRDFLSCIALAALLTPSDFARLKRLLHLSSTMDIDSSEFSIS